MSVNEISGKEADSLIQILFDATPAIRYVALLQNGTLISAQREQVDSASASESDRYEELLVNPTLLTAVRQRGDIDCGGLRFVIVAYGNFFQLLRPYKSGHISVCVELAADPLQIERIVNRVLEQCGHT